MAFIMKIYVVRHGETDWNKKEIIQGRTDNPLNEYGQEQAKEIQSFFNGVKLDKVISSSLIRAKETAFIATGKQPEINDHFIERDFGKFDGQAVNVFYDCDNLNTIQGFETDKEIQSRVIDGLLSLDTDKGTFAIFAHSHVLKSILTYALPKQYNFESKIKNCAILEINILDGVIEIVAIH